MTKTENIGELIDEKGRASLRKFCFFGNNRQQPPCSQPFASTKCRQADKFDHVLALGMHPMVRHCVESKSYFVYAPRGSFNSLYRAAEKEERRRKEERKHETPTVKGTEKRQQR